MIAILMMTEKLVTLGLLKVKTFWDKDLDVIIRIHDVTSKISSRDSNYIANMIMWPKIVNFSISMRGIIIISILQGCDQKNQFFSGVFLVQVQLFRTGTMVLEFFSSVANVLKFKVGKFRRLISTFVEVTGEKLVGDLFGPFHPE